jgi:hypothetical protein
MATMSSSVKKGGPRNRLLHERRHERTTSLENLVQRSAPSASRAGPGRRNPHRRPNAWDVDLRNYLRDQAGSRSLVFDLSITQRYGSSSHPLQNGHLTHPQDIDAPLHIAAERKINSYMQQHADNQSISFLPAIVSTSTRTHGEFCVFVLFLQAHRETEAHFTATGMPSQRNEPDSCRYKRAAFYQSLMSKVGLAAAKRRR